MAERRDNKKRKLWKGEYQKSDGRYMYRYIDSKGNARFVYSWCLTSTDRPPSGKHSDKCLRELEKEIAKDIQDEMPRNNLWSILTTKLRFANLLNLLKILLKMTRLI